jgi:nitrite reductase (NADH) small subunit
MDVASHRNGVPAGHEEGDLEGRWIDVCALDEILPQTGVCALLDRKQVAIFRLAPSDEVFALSNFDPFSKAFVLSRGIVGDRAGVPKVASPVFKHNFDLRTGQCLDDPAVAVKTYPVRVRAGRVEVFFTPHDQAPRAS